MDRGRPAGSPAVCGCGREPGTFAGGGGGGVRAAGWACAEARDAGATSDERSGSIRSVKMERRVQQSTTGTEQMPVSCCELTDSLTHSLTHSHSLTPLTVTVAVMSVHTSPLARLRTSLEGVQSSGVHREIIYE